jgi:pyruvate formate lyase activating enzyme
MSDERGLVVQIQGSSFVDGPGIRTTVFLKGCPLRCLWCCNPECQEGYTEKNRLFPQKGLSEVFGKWLTVSEVIDVVKRDIPYYQTSGGGVTIAGGEPTYQPIFALELIKRCKELGIHTALDTCGYTLNKQAVRVLEEVDLLLYDLKNIDPVEHERNTGVGNDRILENLRRMVELKKDIIIRVPLISGYTDSMENVRAVGDFLASLGHGSIGEIDLLPYHQGGVIKYDMLGRNYPLGNGIEPPSDEYVQEVKQTLTWILGGSCVVNLGG